MPQKSSHNHSTIRANRKKGNALQINDTLSVASPSSTENNIVQSVGARCPAPFSADPVALQTLAECDYSQKITIEMARSGTAPRQVRVYADGVYDMFHSGHARQLMQASAAFPNTYLIVGVTSDADTRARKGTTVMNEAERYEAVRHCRYVDEVLTAAPWECTIDFLKSHKIDFIAHDDIPYATGDCTDAYQPFKEAGMFLTTQRSEGISTTDVIGRILKDYDVYLRRNISRGLSRQELNISYVKEKQLRIENNIQTIVAKGSNLLNEFGTKRRRIVESLEDLYQDVSSSFLRFFGTHGRLQHWWSGTTAAIRSAVSPPASSSASFSAPPSPVSSEHGGHMSAEDAGAVNDEGSLNSWPSDPQPPRKRSRTNFFEASERLNHL